MCLFTCVESKQVFLEHSTTFPFADVPICLKHIDIIKFRINIYLQIGVLTIISIADKPDI